MGILTMFRGSKEDPSPAPVQRESQAELLQQMDTETRAQYDAILSRRDERPGWFLVPSICRRRDGKVGFAANYIPDWPKEMFEEAPRKSV